MSALYEKHLQVFKLKNCTVYFQDFLVFYVHSMCKNKENSILLHTYMHTRRQRKNSKITQKLH